MARKEKAALPAFDAVQHTLDIIRKRFGHDAAVIPAIDGVRSEVRGVVTSGVDVVDRYVCGGGIPRGRITELYSEPGIAKTSFCWTVLGGCQRAGGVAIYCDNEQSFNASRAQAFGMDLERVVLLQPWTLEEALEQMQVTLEGLPDQMEAPVLLAWDSLAGAPYTGDLTGVYSKESADDRAKKIGKFCRVAGGLAVQKQVAILIVNQTRQKRGVLYGSRTTTPGGDAVKFHASLRLELFGGKALKNAKEQHVGKTITFMEMKSRFSQPFRKAKVRLDYERGWDNLWSTINHAKDQLLIPAGSKYNTDTYNQAVEALGWENAAVVVEELESTVGAEDDQEGGDND